MSSEVEIVEVDEKGKIILPQKIREKIGIFPLKESLVFERTIDKAGKKDMSVQYKR